MPRFRLLAVLPIAVTGCSLLVSTDDLAGPADGDAGLAMPNEAGASDVAIPDRDGTTPIDAAPDAASVSPCLAGTFDHCYDFTVADPLSGWTFISPPDSTFDATHFTRATSTSASGPASLRYRHPSANYIYRDALRVTQLEVGDSYYVAFSTKVEKFGTGPQLGTMSLELGDGPVGDIYFYQKDGLVYVSTRYFDTQYLSGPRSPDLQVSTQEQWHRYEVWLTTGSPPRLRFAMDGDVMKGVGVKYDTLLNAKFSPGNATLNIGVWDHDSTPNPGTEHIVYFDDVVFDVTQ